MQVRAGKKIKKVRKILNEILNEINELLPEIPNGSKAKIHLEI